MHDVPGERMLDVADHVPRAHQLPPLALAMNVSPRGPDTFTQVCPTHRRHRLVDALQRPVQHLQLPQPIHHRLAHALHVFLPVVRIPVRPPIHADTTALPSPTAPQAYDPSVGTQYDVGQPQRLR